MSPLLSREDSAKLQTSLLRVRLRLASQPNSKSRFISRNVNSYAPFTPFLELPELSQPKALPDPTGLALVGADLVSFEEVWLNFRSPSPEDRAALSAPFVEVVGGVAELDVVLETLDIVLALGRRIFMLRDVVPVPVPARA